MIQLATDPKASRSWRPSGPTTPKTAGQRVRGAQGWPFLSKAVLKPDFQDSVRQPRSDNGS